MAKPPAKLGQRQRGFAFIVVLTVVVLGFCWYAVGAISKSLYGAGDRDQRTGLALKRAKEALLAHVAQAAADTGELYPGRLPCPEKRSVVGNATLVAATGNAAYDGKTFDSAYAGFAAPFNTTTTPPASAAINCDSPALGRLPWKTLGIDQIRDGDNEPLWYAVANTGTPWAWTAVGDPLVINPSTANALTFDAAANAVVAVIIAPGAVLNTTATAGAPPAACARVNQSARGTPPIAVANFLECGNAAASYTTIGASPWSNDRTISITAAEVMSAIAGAIAYRLQRQVAPAMANWDALEATNTGKSWATTWLGGTAFLPFASQFNTTPSANDYCGDAGLAAVYEGLPPVAAKAVACNSNWTNATSAVTNLGIVGAGSGCVSDATKVTCTFSRVWALVGSATVTADAPNIVSSFRGTIQASDVVITGSNAAGTSATKTVTMAVTSNPDRARITVNVSWPLLSTLADLVYIIANPNVTVTIPHVPDAQVLSDARMTWFLNNNWNRWTYYQVASGSAFGVAAANVCPTNVANCLTVNNLPATNGNPNDKKLVLTFMGASAVAAQVQPNTSSASYLEAHTAPSSIYTYQTVSSTSNDRLAMCPYQETRAAGTIAICN